MSLVRTYTHHRIVLNYFIQLFPDPNDLIFGAHYNV